MKNSKNLTTRKGTLGFQDYKFLIEKGHIFSYDNIPKNSIQPASIDLRLGYNAYEVSASFIAKNQTVKSRLRSFVKRYINISNGFLFKKNKTYLVEVLENLKLNKNISGKCNPKSSTGRLDIFCRVITDYNSEYEIIKKGYKGKLYIEITPKTFDIVFCYGDKLSQLRLRKESTVYLSDKEIIKTNNKYPFLFNKNNKKIDPLIKNGIKISADLEKSNSIIAYRAKKNTQEIVFSKVKFYRITDFWTAVRKKKKNYMIIEPNEFYILKSKEKIMIKPNLAAEMVPYDVDIGEFRVHYAGFFDPGFGFQNNGSHAVLEVKTYEIPFAIEDNQSIARLVFEKLAQVPHEIYGSKINSNYQNQALALSKHFKVLNKR